jgi:HemY protein
MPNLVDAYRKLPVAYSATRLATAGYWLKKHGPRPELFQLLAGLCIQAQLWGKAKDYFAKYLAIQADPLVALEYGTLLEQLGEKDAAVNNYRTILADLSQVTKQLPVTAGER